MFSKLFCNKKLLHFFFLKTKCRCFKGRFSLRGTRSDDGSRSSLGEARASACPRKDGHQLLEKNTMQFQRKIRFSVFWSISLSIYMLYFWWCKYTNLSIYTYIQIHIYDIHIKHVKTTSANCVSRNSVVFVLLTRTDWDVRPEKKDVSC